MSFLVDGFLKSNASSFSQASSPFAYSTKNNLSGPLANSLKINNSEQSGSTSISDIINRKRGEVESRVGSSLLNSSIAISEREAITDSVASTVNTLAKLNEDIKNEVNPLRKSDLISEANTILTELNTSLNTKFTNDPNLQNSVTVQSQTPSPDGATFTNVNVEGISSLAQLGISSLDFNDYEATSTSLNSASLILASKQSSYSSSTTTVSTAVSNEISQFNADVKVLAEVDKEQAANDLAYSVATSIQNFISDGTSPIETILTLLEDPQDQTVQQDSNETNTDNYTEITTNLSSLSINSPSESYLSTSSDDSSISVKA